MIYLPPPQPVLNKDIRLSGDVEIHPTASLAPGVILQAAPNSKIVIGADVCIGMGVIINACQGLIEIESGAILGSGVLIVGSSKIGHNSCIGTSTTIYQENVTPMSVIEPGSIIGDPSRKVVVEKAPSNSKHNLRSQTKTGKNTSKAKRAAENNYYFKEKSGQIPTQNHHENNATASVPSVENVPKPVETNFGKNVEKKTVPVVGQLYINELLVTLFPHRKASDSNLPS